MPYEGLQCDLHRGPDCTLTMVENLEDHSDMKREMGQWIVKKTQFLIPCIFIYEIYL